MSIPQLGLIITPPNLKLYIKAPDLDINTRAPDLTVRTTSPEVIIDLRESFNSMGLKDIAAAMRDVVEEARATVLQGIERRADEGDALGRANGPSVTALADEASKPREKKLEIGLMPSVPPKISAKPGMIKGYYSPGDVSVRLNRGEVNGDFRWGTIEGYLEGESSVDIKA